MENLIIGRTEESAILQRLLTSNQAELLAVYGRRRVGKTFLIRNYYAKSLQFYCSGQLGATQRQQLNNFREQLEAYFPQLQPFQTAESWQEAFSQLRQCLEKSKGKAKKVLFFDELPWLDSHKSGFLSAFSYFWNIYASQRNDLLLVICGSAASWIIKKVINNKGGLHNRITQRIRLLPFNLQETEAYLLSRHIKLTQYQLLQLYMAIGGIPHYLNAVERGKSVPQIIEQICFSKDGALANEFNNLYSALFASAEKHIEIIHALAGKNMGLTRTELLTESRQMTGGGLTTILEELTESGFVTKNPPYNKKRKDALYRLSDEYSFFYLRYMHGKTVREQGQWLAQSNTTQYRSWCGYAFENVCFKHIHQIKKALGIAGIYTEQSSWTTSGNEFYEGAQIDLLIVRSDQSINICEIKFSEHPFKIDKKYAEALQKKILAFKQGTNSKSNTILTFVSTYGLANNSYNEQLVDAEVRMESLFSP
jgi:AAA+ ATPase superfamily predicted ATPase